MEQRLEQADDRAKACRHLLVGVRPSTGVQRNGPIAFRCRRAKQASTKPFLGRLAASLYGCAVSGQLCGLETLVASFGTSLYLAKR